MVICWALISWTSLQIYNFWYCSPFYLHLYLQSFSSFRVCLQSPSPITFLLKFSSLVTVLSSPGFDICVVSLKFLNVVTKFLSWLAFLMFYPALITVDTRQERTLYLAVGVWAAGALVAACRDGVRQTARAAVPLGLCLGWTLWCVWFGVTTGLLFDLWDAWSTSMG